MLRGQGQIYCSSTIAPALFSALIPVSPSLLYPCSRTYRRPALVKNLYIRHPWRKMATIRIKNLSNKIHMALYETQVEVLTK